MEEKTKSYYVYELIDPRDNKIFYVGKGHGKRMYIHYKLALKSRKSNLNQKLYEKLKELIKENYKPIYKKIFETYNEKEAYRIEKSKIKKIGLRNLCNITCGLYRLNYKPSQETKRKLSESHKGQIPWNKGKKGAQIPWNKGLTKETDERMKLISIKCASKSLSQETINKLKKSLKGKIPWNKGKKNLQIPWNKGLTKETDNRVMLYSNKMRRKK